MHLCCVAWKRISLRQTSEFTDEVQWRVEDEKRKRAEEEEERKKMEEEERRRREEEEARRREEEERRRREEEERVFNRGEIIDPVDMFCQLIGIGKKLDVIIMSLSFKPWGSHSQFCC